MLKRLLLLLTVALSSVLCFGASKCSKCRGVAPDGWKLCPKCKAKVAEDQKVAARNAERAKERARIAEEKKRQKEEAAGAAERLAEAQRRIREETAALKERAEEESRAAIAERAKAIDALPPAQWDVERNVDEISDELEYYISVPGEKLTNGIHEYTPRLTVKILPKGMTATGQMLYKSEVLFIVRDVISKMKPTIITRFDKEAPATTEWGISTDSRAAFAPDPGVFIKSISTHQRLTVRFEAFGGAIHTTSFYLPGFNAKLREVKEKYSRSGAR